MNIKELFKDLLANDLYIHEECVDETFMGLTENNHFHISILSPLLNTLLDEEKLLYFIKCLMFYYVMMNENGK